MKTLRIGTRSSDLALRQTSIVCTALRSVDPSIGLEVVTIRTEGDQRPEQLVGEGWTLGVFTSALERALLEGAIDLVVHSLKDLPVQPAPGSAIVTPPREAPHDVLVTARAVALDDLPRGLRIGTSSPRRAAQLRRLGPFEPVPLRGNVPSRLKRVGRDLDGVVLAAAGLRRLGLGPAHAVDLPLDVCVPAPGQGALAVQTRAGDAAVRRLVAGIHDEATWRAVSAERAFLAGLGTGCRLPAGALGAVEGEIVRLHGQLFSPDGGTMVDGIEEGRDAESAGRALAQRLAARLEV
jgi:hydroxymethylbilane synthase